MEMKDFYERHLIELDEKLNKIYTVAVEDYSPDSENSETINTLKELSMLVEMEKVYSLLENEGISEGEIYTQYNGYLEYVRKGIVTINNKIDEIEKENEADIKNINVLMASFRQQLSNI